MRGLVFTLILGFLALFWVCVVAAFLLGTVKP